MLRFCDVPGTKSIGKKTWDQIGTTDGTVGQISDGMVVGIPGCDTVELIFRRVQSVPFVPRVVLRKGLIPLEID